MIKTYKAFKFNNVIYSGFINATVDNDMYSESISGERTIIEEQIPGRDIPYLYRVDSSPLELEVTFALENKINKTALQNFIRDIMTLENYTTLIFGDYNGTTFTAQTPTYYVIFQGSNIFNYIKKGELDYLGYFTLVARCNAPYGFYEDSDISINSVRTLNVNYGDIKTDASIVITVAGNDLSDYTIINYDSAVGGNELSRVSFSNLYAGEIITINGITGTITSTVEGIYERWDRNTLSIFPDSNYIIRDTGAAVSMSYKSGRFV